MRNFREPRLLRFRPLALQLFESRRVLAYQGFELIDDAAVMLTYDSVYDVHSAYDPSQPMRSQGGSFTTSVLLDDLINEAGIEPSSYDHILFYSIQEVPGWIHSGGLITPAKNIGQYNPNYGFSNGRPEWPELRSVPHMNSVDFLDRSITGRPNYGSTLTAFHEIGHDWGVFWGNSPGPRGWNPGDPVGWLAGASAHWSWNWSEPGMPGILYSGPTSDKFNAFDLYAMGLMDYQEASTYSYTIYENERPDLTHQVTLDDMIHVMSLKGANYYEGDGKRIPATDPTIQQLRALIVVVRGADETLTETQRQLVIDLANDIPADWQTATWGRSEMVAAVDLNANDAPVLDDSLSPALDSILEDAATPAGTLVSSLLAGAVRDADPGALQGLAIVAVTGQSTGQWQYSLNNGSSWQNLPTPSETAARLLPSDAQTRLRYVPQPHFNGPVEVGYFAWDQTEGTPGSTLDTTTRRGAGGTFSTLMDAARLSVVSVNDAPVLATGSLATLNAINEDAPNPIGTLVSNFANSKISDPDGGALKGIAVVGLTEKTKGVWQFSTDGGASWEQLGNGLSDTLARVLAPNNRVRFVPGLNYSGTPQLKFRAWDQSDGKMPGNIVNTDGKRGGSGAYSTAVLSAKLVVTPVNDRPVLTLGGSLGYQRNSPAVVLAPNTLVADPDSPNFGGGQLRVRITLGGGSNNTLAIGSGFTVDGSNNVKLGTTIIGKRLSNGIGTNELKIQFNANATKAIVQQLVRSITYKNVNGAAGQRKIVFTVSDGDGGLSDERFKTVNVT